MTAMMFQLLGGIGLFLLGMVLLTDGLKAYAGEALRQALVRFTGTPTKAFASGALVTLLVQSSSATTVALIGFVSAGLLTFPQAVGVVLGASLGTTGTGWVVSVLGLKVSLGLYALPLVGIGALLRLLAHGRWRALGLALAGFGLIFIGIETLQNGMRTLGGVFDLAALPAAGLLGHLAALAIGTSCSISPRVSALLLLPAWLWGLAQAQRYAGLEPGAVSLAAFHTAFIALGVAVFLPFAGSFARQIERLLPDKGPRLTRHLDDTLLQAPAVALEATRRTLMDVTLELLGLLAPLLDSAVRGVEQPRRAENATALERTQRFFAQIPPVAGDEPLSRLRVAQLHAIDHLVRLIGRLDLPAAAHRALLQPPMRTAVTQCREVLAQARTGLIARPPADWLAGVEHRALTLDELRRAERLEILRQTAAGEHGPAEAMAALDATRCLSG